MGNILGNGLSTVLDVMDFRGEEELLEVVLVCCVQVGLLVEIVVVS